MLIISILICGNIVSKYKHMLSTILSLTLYYGENSTFIKYETPEIKDTSMTQYSVFITLISFK